MFVNAQGTSLWKTRTLLEKTLLILTSVLFVSVFIMICLLCKPVVINQVATDHDQHLIDQVSQICVTENCVHAASNILNSIDASVKPCDDFYAFACNNWIRKNPIPDGKSLWGTFGKLEQQNHLVVKNVLERGKFNSIAEKKAKLYYQSCLDEDETLEKLSGTPMAKLIQSIGGWNLTVSGYNASTWTLQRSLQTVQNKYNMGGLFTWVVGEDDRNSSRHVIQIDQGGLTLPTREHYLNKTAHGKVLSAYLDYMTKVAVLLGADRNEAEQQMQAVIDFETKLAEITSMPPDTFSLILLKHTFIF